MPINQCITGCYWTTSGLLWIALEDSMAVYSGLHDLPFLPLDHVWFRRTEIAGKRHQIDGIRSVGCARGRQGGRGSRSLPFGRGSTRTEALPNSEVAVALDRVHAVRRGP